MPAEQKTPEKHYLTQAAYEKLAAELAALTENRPVLAAEINARREEGDLKENGGYHAAKDEQGKQEARIRQLERLLHNAVIGTAPGLTIGVAAPGMLLTVRYEDDDDTETFLLGSREAARHSDVEVYSPQSAIGMALTGAKAGETREYQTNTGRSLRVTLLAAELPG